MMAQFINFPAESEINDAFLRHGTVIDIIDIGRRLCSQQRICAERRL